MGFAVYEMPSVSNAPAQFRESINALKEKLRQADPSHNLGFVPYFDALGNCWFKKWFDKWRLVAKLVEVELDQDKVRCVVFAGFMYRDSTEYGDGDPSHLEKTLGPLIQKHWERIRDEVRSQRSGEPPPPPPPDPPEYLRRLLDPLRPVEKTETFFISPHFTKCYEKLKCDTERADVYRALCRIYNEISELLGRQLEASENLCRVSYVRLKDPEHRCHHVYLLGVVSDNWQESDRQDASEKISECRQQLQRQVLDRIFPDARSYSDALSQLAERAFPGYLLVQEELWRRIWEEREVFLALSTEEMNRLESILTGQKLPCVIEGRAGSGKSTLLIYYTAERLAQAPENQENQRYRALYISQSKSLLDKAKKLIQEICHRLRNEYTRAPGIMDDVYQTYYDFALEQLPPERRERFSESRRIGGGHIAFPLFAELLRGHGPDGLRDSFGRSRDCSPEVVWFILRSYIKGYKIHEQGEQRWMPPDEYIDPEQIKKKDRQVSEELYEKVWTCVWPWYKQLTVPCRENNHQPSYWDDVDLAWEVLEYRRSDAPQFDVLVCDEAQDFTRVEIASLLRALSWAKYNLGTLRDLLGRAGGSLALPVVFAGDAHQTVNPSCFRWARVSADISQSLTQNLANLPAIRIPTLELRFNYRNAPSIAQLCNAVQHLRQVALGQSAALQTIWHPDEEQPNLRVRRLLLDRNPQQAKQTLEILLQEGVLVIGPVPNDPDLDIAQTFWERLGFERPPEVERKNYVVAADIKGLEQDLVAVVGFGVMFKLLGLDGLWNWKDAVNDPQVSEAKRFQAEYFLNNLYVAISRAREQLWIIETEEGWESFWKQLSEWLKQTDIAANEQDREVDFVWSPGDVNELVQAFGKQWPRLAEECERLAHDQKSADQAERSAYYYARMGRVHDQNRMLAWATYYRGSTLEAAHKMWEINQAQASDWFWEAAANNDRAWQQMADKSDLQPSWRHELAELYIRVQVPSCDAACFTNIVGLLQKLHGKGQIQQDRNTPRWPTWERLLLGTFEAISRSRDLSEELRRGAYQVCHDLAPQSHLARAYQRWQILCAQLAYGLGKYPDAIQHWENAGDTQHQSYYLAKAQVSSYPECLKWWESASEYERIWAEFEGHKDVALDPSDRLHVARAAELRQNWQIAFEMYTGLDSDRAFECLERLLQSTAAARDIVSSVREILMAAQRYACPELPANQKQISQWTNHIFDLFLFCRERGFKGPGLEERKEEVVRALVRGFALGNDPDALARRFHGSWETRFATRSSWPVFSQYLQQLSNYAAQWCQTHFNSGTKDDLTSAAWLAWLVLGLVWRFEKREKSGSERLPFYRAVFRDYFEIPEMTFSALAGLDPGMMLVVTNALRCTADGPADWLCETANSREGEIPFGSLADPVDALAYDQTETQPLKRRRGCWLLDAVDALAYDLTEMLADGLRSLRLGTKLPDYDWWLLCGKFIEQAPFRRRALVFYQYLLQLGEQTSWPREQIALVRQNMEEYKRRRKPYVNPGERYKTDMVHIKSLKDRPCAVFNFQPDEYQLRFIPPETGMQPFVTCHEELKVLGPEVTEDALVYTVVHRDRWVKIQWHLQKRVLYVKIDRDRRVYVVSFASA